MVSRIVCVTSYYYQNHHRHHHHRHHRHHHEYDKDNDNQARRVCYLLWLLAALLSAPTLVARVYVEVCKYKDKDKGEDKTKKKSLQVGERVTAYWCILDWDRPWLWR